MHKFAFSGKHWTGLSIEKCKNSVFVVLIKISISVLNFSPEWAKKTNLNLAIPNYNLLSQKWQ